MRFDWTVTLGNVLSAIGMVGGIWAVAWKTILAIDKRLESFQYTLQAHAGSLQSHDKMLGTYEVRLFELVATVQRILGRLESVDERHNDRASRRKD